MKSLLRTLHVALMRLHIGNRAVAACFGIALLSCIAGQVQAGPTHELMVQFDRPPQKAGYGSLALGPDGCLWGTTIYGGIYNSGSIYKVTPDTETMTAVVGLTNTGASNKGVNPYAGLLNDGTGFLWGTTSQGGANGYGTVFKVDATTGALTTLADFTSNGAINKGARPYAGLVSDGAGFFWGTTYQGGPFGYGTIFKVNTSTGALTTVLEFTNNGASNRGAYPYAGLVSDGAGFLWGTTNGGGGVGGYGTVFKVDATTGVLTTVVEFTSNGASNKGAKPYAALVSDGAGFFWGTTYQGGAGGNGTIFKVNASTGELTTVLEFTYNGASNRGAFPYAGLVNDGAGSLWGTTSQGGVNYGTVFKVNVSTGALTTLKEFTYTSSHDGRTPYAGLVSDGAGNFWGTTYDGGASGCGTVFKVNANTGVFTSVLELGNNEAGNRGTNLTAGLVSDEAGFLWGTTRDGGAIGYGTVFKMNARTGSITAIVDFTANGASNKGSSPYPSLVSDGAGYFWGTTNGGGGNGHGTVFKVNASTGALTTVVEFTGDGAINKGRSPRGGLVSDGAGYFWGTTSAGGSSDWGTVYKVNASTGVLTTLMEFNSPVNAYAGLVSDGAGFFWGTTYSGGGNGYGTVFKVDTSTGVLTTVAAFTSNGASNKGANPYASLVNDGEGFLWGTCSAGGANGYGTVFKVNASSGELTTVVEFTNTGASNRGANPYGSLVRDEAGFFWGTTNAGGASGAGTVFKLDSTSGALTTVLEFTGSGSQPNCGTGPAYGSLLKYADGNYYGTTSGGGPGGAGTIFRLRFGPTPVTQSASEITPHTAKLNGTVNPNNDGATSAIWQYGTSPTLSGAATVSAGTVANASSPAAVSTTVTGLLARTTYYYQLVASNAGNSIPQEGQILSFTTTNTAPVAPNGTVMATPGEVKTINLPFAATDADGDPVSLTNVTPGAGLTVNSFSGYNATFTVASEFTGPSTLNYTLEDGWGGVGTGTITVKNGVTGIEQLVVKGRAVPGAGIADSGIPAGATWNTFGLPAINGTGNVAFAASLKLTPNGTLTGVFAGTADAPVLLARKRDAAPEAGGAVFAAFKDPLFNEECRIAFVATLSGARVTGANKRGIWTNALGVDASAFELVAREGASVPGVTGAYWKSFRSVALASGELNVLGIIAGSGVTRANDTVLCRYTATAPDGQLLLRKGQELTVDGATSNLKSFLTLAPVKGSPGQRRQPLTGGLHVKATLQDGRVCLLNNIGAADLSQMEALSGDALTAGAAQPAGTLESLGLAADASGGTWGSVFKALLTGPGASIADNQALVRASASGLSILARKGEEADATRAPGALIEAFSLDPVAIDGRFAGVVSLSGTGVLRSNDTGLLYRGTGFNGLLAREGDSAQGAGGALFGSFLSLALPDGATGPIFVAKLSSGETGVRVTTRNNIGLWAADSSGVVRLLLRKGDRFEGKKVVGFTVLPLVPGSAAQARSYNDAGQIAAKVTFTDGTQAIVRITVP